MNDRRDEDAADDEPVTWDSWRGSSETGRGGAVAGAVGDAGRSFDPFGYGYGAGGTAGYAGDIGPGWNQFERRGGLRPYPRGDWVDDDGARDFVADAREPDRRGAFVGRGPRGYRRNDARVRDDVCEALTRDPHVDASDVEVTVEGGEVTLAGAVEDRRQKRIAESLAERLEGVRDVHNRIRVTPTADAPRR